MAEAAKYRVTYIGFDEYVQCSGIQSTNVHTVMECDVAAETSQEALLMAAKAFGLSDTDKGGEWKVRMTKSPQDPHGAIGCGRNESTIVNNARQY